MKISLNHFVLVIVLTFAGGAFMIGCGDDDGGTNDNNDNQHHYYDASAEASVSYDAHIEVDATQMTDAEVEVDAFTEADAGEVVGEGAIGDPCGAPGDCSPPTGLTAECLTDIGGFVQFPGGYCTAECTAEGPDPCEPDGVCVNLMMTSYCLKPCQDISDCREDDGYECDDPMGQAGTTVCVPPIGM